MYQVKEEEVECTLSMSAEEVCAYKDNEEEAAIQNNLTCDNSNNNVADRLQSISDVFSSSEHSFDEFISTIKSSYEIASVQLLHEEFFADESERNIFVKLNLKPLTSLESKFELSEIIDPGEKEGYSLLKEVTSGEIDFDIDSISDPQFGTAKDEEFDGSRNWIKNQDLGESGSNGFFVCEDCGICYKKNNSLLRHRRKKHKNVLHCEMNSQSDVENNDSNVNSTSDNEIENSMVTNAVVATENEIATFDGRVIKKGACKNDIKCNFCGRVFTLLRSLVKHKRLQICRRSSSGRAPIKPRSILCDICGKSYHLRSLLLRHQLKMHLEMKDELIEQKPYQCSYCGELFRVNDKLKNHILERHQNHKYQCELCDVDPFTNINSYRYHITKFHRPKKCTICGVTCTGRVGFADHLRTVHSTADFQTVYHAKNFKCEKCDECFSCPALLEEHDWTSHRGIRFDCHICGKKLKGSKCLKIHMRVHGIGVLHRCEECETNFSDKTMWVNHMRIKHPERLPEKYASEFPCPDCNKTFKIGASLRKHREVIHEGKYHNCPTCQKSFRSKSGISNHMKTCFKAREDPMIAY